MSNSRFFLICYPYMVCLVGGLFVFYKYLLQVSPSVMSSDLMRDFHITGAGLGNLTACFLYTYLLMQIPAGILLDRYNPRHVIVTTISLCAVFTLLFALSSSEFMACIARAGIGLAAAFSFSAYLKVVTLWAPPRHFAFMTSLVFTIAMLGAIGGQLPLGLLVVNLGWRQALIVTAILGFLLALLCWFLMGGKPPRAEKETAFKKPMTSASFFAQLLEMIKNKQNWLLGIYCGCTFAPLSAFGGLWGVPFLEQAYHLTKINAAGSVSLIYIGIAIGCPFFGWISDQLKRRLVVMALGTFVGCLSLTGIIYLSHVLNPFLLNCLLFSFGFWTSALMLCFVVAVEIQTVLFAASLIAFINTIPSIFEAVTEPLIGKILDMGWNGVLANGARVFSVENYRVGLLILPLYLVVALILLKFCKERSQDNFHRRVAI